MQEDGCTRCDVADNPAASAARLSKAEGAGRKPKLPPRQPKLAYGNGSESGAAEGDAQALCDACNELRHSEAGWDRFPAYADH